MSEERGGVAEERFDSAVALVAEGRHGEAGEQFAPLATRFERAGDAGRAAECLFWLGYCQEKQGRLADARLTYERVQSRYAETPAARQAAERLALLPPDSPR